MKSQPEKDKISLDVLKSFASTQEQSFFLHKVADWNPASFQIKRLHQNCFPVSYKIFKNTFFMEHLRTIASEKARGMNWHFSKYLR